MLPTSCCRRRPGTTRASWTISPAQSQTRTIRAAGLERAYALDWIGATASTKDATIDDYLDVIERAIDRIGEPVNVIGDCQGGWLATIYAARRPEHVNTLTIAGARAARGASTCAYSARTCASGPGVLASAT